MVVVVCLLYLLYLVLCLGCLDTCVWNGGTQQYVQVCSHGSYMLLLRFNNDMYNMWSMDNDVLGNSNNQNA